MLLARPEATSINSSWKRVAVGSALLAVLVQMTGCGILGGLGGLVGGSDKEKITKPSQPLKVKNVSLNMLPAANQNWPVAVELVRVRDVELVDALLRIKTEDWFGEAGNNFRQAHPDALYDAWEVVPGTNVGPFKVRKRGRFAGVLFCRTRAGSPPLRFNRNGNVVINIDNTGCTPSGGKRARRGFRS